MLNDKIKQSASGGLRLTLNASPPQADIGHDAGSPPQADIDINFLIRKEVKD